jgi:hypothetical protein
LKLAVLRIRVMIGENNPGDAGETSDPRIKAE